MRLTRETAGGLTTPVAHCFRSSDERATNPGLPSGKKVERSFSFGNVFSRETRLVLRRVSCVWFFAVWSRNESIIVSGIARRCPGNLNAAQLE